LWDSLPVTGSGSASPIFLEVSMKGVLIIVELILLVLNIFIPDPIPFHIDEIAQVVLLGITLSA
jgi:hypothetical protein